ncbi:MAG: nucleotidyltransferase domain-containing protein [Candidatus Paceibacterota bacterium]
MDKDLFIKEAVKIIGKYLSDDYKVVLFGSWARGNALDTSDIDIGIIGEKEVARGLMHKILEEIDKLPTLRSIDIVDLMSTEENYKNKILEYAKPLA